MDSDRSDSVRNDDPGPEHVAPTVSEAEGPTSKGQRQIEITVANGGATAIPIRQIKDGIEITINDPHTIHTPIPIRRIKEEIGRALSRELRIQNRRAAFEAQMEEWEASWRWARTQR